MSSRASQRAKLTQSDWGLWTTDARQRVITIGGSETFGSVCPKNLSWLRPRDTDCFPPSSRIRSGYKIFVSPGLSPCVGRKKKTTTLNPMYPSVTLQRLGPVGPTCGKLYKPAGVGGIFLTSYGHAGIG